DTARTVALVAHFLVARAFELAGTAFDRALDVVLRHALRLRLVDRKTQPRGRRRIAAAFPGGDRDLANQLREDLAAFDILGPFPEADVGPLAVTGHVTAPPAPKAEYRIARAR